MKADFAPVKLNIGLDKVYFFGGKGHFWSRKRGFVLGEVNFGSAGKPIWVGLESQFEESQFEESRFGLGENGFCFSEFDSVSV